MGKLHPLMPEMSKDGVRKVVESLILEYFEMETKTRFSKQNSNTRKEMDNMDQQCIGG